jgi:hypothetical protein
MSKAVDCAKKSLHSALDRLSELEETDKNVEAACDHIRDVLDQLTRWCHKSIHLFGQEDAVG